MPTIPTLPHHGFRPLFSPQFISADAAAVYVSLQIGRLRDREYGGLIFSRGDKYIATTPYPGTATSFDSSTVFPQIDGHPQRVPKGLKLVGLYHSHSGEPDAPLISNFFSTTDIFSAITYKRQLPALYLSNPDGSLLKYSAGDTPDTRALLARVTPPNEDDSALSPLQHELAQGRSSAEAFIQAVAEAGHLQVLLGSDVWEPGARVSPRWQPGAPRGDLIAPQYLGPSFRTEDDAMRWLISYAPQSSEHTLSVGIVLKNNVDDTYTTVYATPHGDVGFSLESFLPANAEGVGELPVNHSVSGFYFAPLANHTTGGALTLDGSHLFVSPQLIFAITSKLLLNPAMTAYVWTEEGVLFKYRSHNTDLQKALLSDLLPFGGPRSRVHQALANGTMNVTQFIQRVAAAVELSVVHANGSWPSRGTVPADWTPSGPPPVKPTIRRLGPLFTAADDAVNGAITGDSEAFIGVVLHDTRRSAYTTGVLTFATTFSYHHSGIVDLQASRRLPLPEGYAFHGLYFYPGKAGEQAYPGANQIFHPQALAYFFMLIAHGVDVTHAYWATPHGALIKYSSRASDREDALISKLSAVASGQPGRLLQAMINGTATVEQLIRALARAGELTVLRTDDVWQQRGVVSPD